MLIRTAFLVLGALALLASAGCDSGKATACIHGQAFSGTNSMGLPYTPIFDCYDVAEDCACSAELDGVAEYFYSAWSKEMTCADFGFSEDNTKPLDDLGVFHGIPDPRDDGCRRCVDFFDLTPELPDPEATVVVVGKDGGTSVGGTFNPTGQAAVVALSATDGNTARTRLRIRLEALDHVTAEAAGDLYFEFPRVGTVNCAFRDHNTTPDLPAGQGCTAEYELLRGTTFVPYFGTVTITDDGCRRSGGFNLTTSGTGLAVGMDNELTLTGEFAYTDVSCWMQQSIAGAGDLDCGASGS